MGFFPSANLQLLLCFPWLFSGSVRSFSPMTRMKPEPNPPARKCTSTASRTPCALPVGSWLSSCFSLAGLDLQRGLCSVRGQDRGAYAAAAGRVHSPSRPLRNECSVVPSLTGVCTDLSVRVTEWGQVRTHMLTLVPPDVRRPPAHVVSCSHESSHCPAAKGWASALDVLGYPISEEESPFPWRSVPVTCEPQTCAENPAVRSLGPRASSSRVKGSSPAGVGCQPQMAWPALQQPH